MAKGTMLDRLAEAMGTLNKRPRKGLTPRQRVANAQRWNSLADIYTKELGRIESKDHKEFLRTLRDNEQLGLVSEPWLRNIDIDAIPDAELAAGADVDINDNPFLSDNIDKYVEQSEFLDWCRYNRVEPNGRNLKQFRWETYKTLPERQRVWIANKDAIKSYLGPEMWHYDEQELDRINTIDELEEYLQTRHPEDGWPAHYPLYNDEVTPAFESMDEFPDDFDYMWRY